MLKIGILRMLPLLLGGAMALSGLTGMGKLPYWNLAASIFAALSGVFLMLGAAGWLIFCYRAERNPEQEGPWRRGVLECYGASALSCFATAAIRGAALSAPLAVYGSELIFGAVILLATGAVGLRWRRRQGKHNEETPWEP